MTGRPYGKLLSLEGGGKKSPKAPDYTAAAEAQGKSAIEAARVAANAQRMNQVTPYGTLNFSHTGDDPDLGWTATQSLAPGQQQILDSRTNLTNAMLSNPTFQSIMNSGGRVDQSKLPAMPINPGQSVQDAIMARLQPQIAQSNEQLDAQMANQGLMPGSAAYKNAQRVQGQNNNDLMLQAVLQGMNTGLAANNQAFNQEVTNNTMPLNLMNSLQSGAQVSNPNLITPTQQNATPGTDYMGAATAQGAYNSAQSAANQSQFSNLLGTGVNAALMSRYLGIF